MDFFNEIMKFGDIFESQETIDELKDISDEIKKYDVYDVLPCLISSSFSACIRSSRTEAGSSFGS